MLQESKARDLAASGAAVAQDTVRADRQDIHPVYGWTKIKGLDIASISPFVLMIIGVFL